MVNFVNNLTHSSGDYARESFDLRDWQEAIVRKLFSINTKTNRRQYRTCLMMLPRKNGKTELVAALALYGLLGDGEIGAQVILAAADREQAGHAYNAAVAMVRADPELEAVCEIVESQKRIVHRESGSILRAIAAEAYSKHGFNASMVIYDELHAAPNRELWDVLRTSQGGRSQPLMIAISTAGYDRHSILFQVYDYACRVRDGVVDDPSFLPVIYEAPKDADWLSEDVWYACNPALDDFRSLEDMRILAREAKEMPAAENSFRRLYLNQWTEQAERWISMPFWDACLGAAPKLQKAACYVGMDLSSTRDLTALVGVFPMEKGFWVVAKFFIPEQTVQERTRRDRVPYEVWARDGHVVTTPGEVVNYEWVRRTVNEWGELYDVKGIAYDPWNAMDLVTRLSEEDGFVCTPMRQGFASMSSPTKALEKAIISKELQHDGNPVLRWCLSNAAVETDPAGNVKLSKKASTERIDGAVALAMAVDTMNRSFSEPQPDYSMHFIGGRR